MGPYLAGKAPQVSPNVLLVLYDDTGLVVWSPFGGRIEMLTMDGSPATGSPTGWGHWSFGPGT